MVRASVRNLLILVSRWIRWAYWWHAQHDVHSLLQVDPVSCIDEGLRAHHFCLHFCFFEHSVCTSTERLFEAWTSLAPPLAVFPAVKSGWARAMLIYSIAPRQIVMYSSSPNSYTVLISCWWYGPWIWPSSTTFPLLRFGISTARCSYFQTFVLYALSRNSLT